MKFKYIFSLVSSFFLAATAKSQQKTPVKKETAPQVKTDPGQVVSTNKDWQVADKNTAVMPDKHMPVKGAVTPDKNTASLPITVKPGDVIFAADFKTEEIGEMPKGWKSSGIGELKTVEGKEGKWLKMDEATKYETAYTANLPENYKIEFDFLANYKADQTVPELTLRVFQKGEEYREPGVSFLISPNGGSAGASTSIQVTSYETGGAEKFRSTKRHLALFEIKNGKNEPVHVTLSVKGQQVKAWLDTEKVYDLQEVVPLNTRFNRVGLVTSTYGGGKENYQYYISNFRITAE